MFYNRIQRQNLNARDGWRTATGGETGGEQRVLATIRIDQYNRFLVVDVEVINNGGTIKSNQIFLHTHEYRKTILISQCFI